MAFNKKKCVYIKINPDSCQLTSVHFSILNKVVVATKKKKKTVTHQQKRIPKIVQLTRSYFIISQR